jgi:hypothetical protein
MQWNKRYVPSFMINFIKRFILKPELKYLELHLVDHCNLSCKGCGHYSPLAKPSYADINQHKIDMFRLRTLFRNILEIRLMGGEPLLHQDPASFITVTRSAFPHSDIHFVTNGILLPKATTTFWNACRNTNTTIDITAYPPLVPRIKDLQNLCTTERVNLIVRSVETFHAHRNLKGNSDKEMAFNFCRSKFYCPFLKNGYLYACQMPANIHYFNKSFGYQIAVDGAINIHSQQISGQMILKQLNNPIDTCKWCSYDFTSFPWSVSNKVASDWSSLEHLNGEFTAESSKNDYRNIYVLTEVK